MSATKVKLYFVRETTLARCYSILPKSRNPGKSDEVWLPFSQIEGTTKYPPKTEDEWPVHIVTIPEWLARTKNL